MVALANDVKAPNRLYAGVVNDKMYGGVFTSGDDGHSWQQQSQGLDGRDVFSLAESPDGTLLAGNRPRHLRVAGWPVAACRARRPDGGEDDSVRRKGKRVKTIQTVGKACR